MAISKPYREQIGGGLLRRTKSGCNACKTEYLTHRRGWGRIQMKTAKGTIIGVLARDIRKGTLIEYSFTGKNTRDIIQKGIFKVEKA